MYCTRCGTQLNETAKFCCECGHATAQAASSSFQQSYAHTPFSRPREGRKIAGVCAGFARYLNVDVTLVRLIAIVLLLFPPSCGLLAANVRERVWAQRDADRADRSGGAVGATVCRPHSTGLIGISQPKRTL
jgi:phage shock protein C